MRRAKRNVILRQETIAKAAQYFLTGNQEVKNKCIDVMLEEQPAFVDYLRYLDKGHSNDLNKEIIVQLLAIIYTGIKLQKIKLKPIKYGKIERLLETNAQMKNYFHHKDFEFDEKSFGDFYKNYHQKHILNYTYFAINNQYGGQIKEERDAIFIFYTVKVISDVITQSVK